MDIIMNSYCKIFSPLIGVVVSLDKVPDPVFAQKMVGDGIAINPSSPKIYAPIDGVIDNIHRAKHAITIQSTNKISLLIHLGLDTVELNGCGFNWLVKQGDKIRQGDILGELDIDFITKSGKSMISPIILPDLDTERYSLIYLSSDGTNIASCDTPLMQVECLAPHDTILQQKSCQLPSGLIKSVAVKINYVLGIHARPAALLSARAGELSADSDVLIEKNGLIVSLKDVMALSTLAVEHNDTVYFYSRTNEINQELIKFINTNLVME